ncbi:MAG: hypothetical protein COB07_06440 [Sulfurovum sp.]|nr:MAG: hypothetical protein COB07_06440 [Sulfurovum sp.]
MSSILFPIGLKIDFRDINLEEMEFYARSWSLERIQIQKGSFYGSMIVTHTPHIQLMRTPYSHGVLLRGDFPKGTVLIAFVVTKADISFQNKLAVHHQIKILRSGDEIDFLCTGESETFVLSVKEGFFTKAYYSYFNEDFNSHTKNKEFYIEPESFSHFVKGIENWMSYLMKDHTTLPIDTYYPKIESEILHHVFSYIYLEENAKRKQTFHIKNVRDLLHQSIEESISIPHITTELSISERTLHHSFKAQYGVTPKKYLLALRMHAIKQELILADPRTEHISSVALRYNFYNMSTFTAAYKNMFGELPSLTLQRQS